MTADERNHIRACIDRARRAQELGAKPRGQTGCHGFAATAYDAANGDGWEALAAAVTVTRLIRRSTA